jgi:hypothetical protein
MSIDHESEETELTHEDCLDHHHEDSPCGGVVEYCPTYPVRYYRSGAFVVFPRCEKHYEEYCDKGEARELREQDYQASLYCKHGTYVGDAWGADYLCGRCEGE